MGESFDAVVIGAGVIGCSVAYALAAGGRSVVVVDREAAVASGSTSASSTIVRFNYSTFAGVASAWESRFAWADWGEHLHAPAGETLARLFVTGGLTIDRRGPSRDRILALFDRVGVPFEQWSAADIAERLTVLATGSFYPPKPVTDPAFWADPTGEISGYFTPDAGFVDDPQLAARNLMDAARRRGARFRFRAPVSAIMQASGSVVGVRLADGSVISSPVVVNVAGPHSAVINRMAGVGDDFTVHTAPMRQEVHRVPAPAGYNSDGPGPFVADLDLGIYFRGTTGDGLLVGGTEPECDPLHWLDDADDFVTHPTRALYEAQVMRAARRLPGLSVPDTPRGVVGIYDVCDDWIPIYDRTGLPGFYVAIGTSGNQFKNAPIVGGYLAAIVDACENGHDHDVEPVTVALPRSGHRVDLRHYSRRRVSNQESSHSVMG